MTALLFILCVCEFVFFFISVPQGLTQSLALQVSHSLHDFLSLASRVTLHLFTVNPQAAATKSASPLSFKKQERGFPPF